MEREILKDVSPSERLDYLKSSADKVEKFTFSRELSQGEVQELQKDLSQSMIFIDQEEQKLRLAKEEFKASVKPEKQKMAKTLTMIRAQVEEVTEEVYLLKDVAENQMGYYSKDGKLVFVRNLRQEEMQFSIQEHLRKAE